MYVANGDDLNITYLRHEFSQLPARHYVMRMEDVLPRRPHTFPHPLFLDPDRLRAEGRRRGHDKGDPGGEVDGEGAAGVDGEPVVEQGVGRGVVDAGTGAEAMAGTKSRWAAATAAAAAYQGLAAATAGAAGDEGEEKEEEEEEEGEAHRLATPRETEAATAATAKGRARRKKAAK